MNDKSEYLVKQDTQPVKVDGRINAFPDSDDHVGNEFRRSEHDHIGYLSLHVGDGLENRSKPIQERVYARRR